jgi:hypothetical protein
VIEYIVQIKRSDVRWEDFDKTDNAKYIEVLRKAYNYKIKFRLIERTTVVNERIIG